MASKASKVKIRLESGTGGNTLISSWEWKKSYTDKYEYVWQYRVKYDEKVKKKWRTKNIWITDSTGSLEAKSGVALSLKYSIPTEASIVRFKVKPVSKTHTVKDKKGNKHTKCYWTAGWSKWVTYDVTTQTPDVPTGLSSTLWGNKKGITASVTVPINSGDVNQAVEIEFCLYNRADKKSSCKTANVHTKTGVASVNFDLSNGNTYRVSCRAIDAQKNKSAWCEYVPANPDFITALPASPAEINEITLLDTNLDNESKTINIKWSKSTGVVTGYEIQYIRANVVDSKNVVSLLNRSDSVKSVSLESTNNEYDITVNDNGDMNGSRWWFRIRAVNSTGKSGWTSPKSLVVGDKPNPPTSWSLESTVEVGDKAVLYWIHNTIDGSKEKQAEIQLTINDIDQDIITIDKKDDESISQYSISTDAYNDGVIIKWKVRTKGVYKDYSDWSVVRAINVVAIPTMEFSILQEETDTNNLDVLTKYPFYVSAKVGPENQNVLRWYIDVTYTPDDGSGDIDYEAYNVDGTMKVVNVGDSVYSKHYDNSENTLSVMLSATDVALSNNSRYTIKIKAVMNTGKFVESSYDFTVSYEDDTIDIGALIDVDDGALIARITPSATDPNDDEQSPLGNLYFSVFRINFDGSFTEIASNIDSSLSATVVDIHPALDIARYRIVATSKETGKITFEDFSEIVGDDNIIIQWNGSAGSNDFAIDTDDTNSIEEYPEFTGELLRLPWNIDTSESHSKDVELVEYIGRKYPVAYRGTQLGETATWNTDIDKNDAETLYALRRLAIYQGDVYVREPSGVGYWADVSVSMNSTHATLVIPVTLTITHVEGGA